MIVKGKATLHPEAQFINLHKNTRHASNVGMNSSTPAQFKDHTADYTKHNEGYSVSLFTAILPDMFL